MIIFNGDKSQSIYFEKNKSYPSNFEIVTVFSIMDLNKSTSVYSSCQGSGIDIYFGKDSTGTYIWDEYSGSNGSYNNHTNYINIKKGEVIKTTQRFTNKSYQFFLNEKLIRSVSNDSYYGDGTYFALNSEPDNDGPNSSYGDLNIYRFRITDLNTNKNIINYDGCVIKSDKTIYRKNNPIEIPAKMICVKMSDNQLVSDFNDEKNPSLIKELPTKSELNVKNFIDNLNSETSIVSNKFSIIMYSGKN